MKALKRHRFIVICVLIDLLLFWFLFYSGLILPYVNLTLEKFKADLTNAPRNVGQFVIWIVAHMPTSGLISLLKLPDAFLVVSVVQTAIIAHAIEKLMWRKKKFSNLKLGG